MSSHPMQTSAVQLAEVPSPSEFERELERFLRHVQNTQTDEQSSLRRWLDVAEAWKITNTLKECRGNRSAAARKLGIGRRTLYAKMEKLQITPTWA